MANVLALVPARAGSKGIPNKNFRLLAGVSPTQRAIETAMLADCHPIVLSSDASGEPLIYPSPCIFLPRPPELAQDDTPMIDVVKHALSAIQGPPDEIILLVQPTQLLRQPKHLRAAIELLETSGADSVVSVVEVPKIYHGRMQAILVDGSPLQWWSIGPACRQDLGPTYIRDGTCYAFRRATVTRYGNIYGLFCRALIVPPDETCPLDTPEDWQNAERRLRALSQV